MKFAQFSDIHYSPETLDEVDRCFEFAIEKAIDAKCDLAVITGDTFDRRVELHSPCVSRVLERIAFLGDHMPVIILQGTYSHDAPGSLDVFKTLGARHPIHVADTIQQVVVVQNKGADWGDDEGSVRFYPSTEWKTGWGKFTQSKTAVITAVISCLPTTNRAALVAQGMDAQDMGQAIADVLKGWAPIHEQARAGGVPSIVLSHGTVAESVSEHGVPMVSLDNEFTTGSLFASGADAIMLGHIHKHQAWVGGGQAIAYPGSIGRLHYGEVDPKGFLIWTVEPGGAEFEFIRVPARELVHLDFAGPPDLGFLRQYQRPGIEGAPVDVRVRVQIDEEHRASVDRAAIEAALGWARTLKVEVKVNPIQRTRAEGISHLDDTAKLARWADITGTDPAPIVERLNTLKSSAPETIAQDILQ